MLDKYELHNFVPVNQDPRQLSLVFETDRPPEPDIRAPAEIALAIVESIFGADNELWERPIRITEHRDHVSPIGKERRRVAPLAMPAPAISIIRTPVKELGRDDAGKIDLTELRRTMRETPKDRHKSVRRIAMAACIAAGIIGYAAPHKEAAPVSHEMPGWAKRIFAPIDDINNALPQEKPVPRRRRREDQ